MDQLDAIQRSLDYIEENLKAELTAQELAQRANYSLYHYYRLFQASVGMPVMQYIGRRKLLHAIYEMGCGKKHTDTALAYGFDTYAGFYRAFLREFGYTPRQFLTMYKLNKPYRIDLSREEDIMITHKRISRILTSWDLAQEEIRDVFYDSGQRNDHAFHVGDQYVIKIFADPGRLKKHMDISKALENCGLSAAGPVKTPDGKEFIEDGTLFFLLTRRSQAQPMKAAELYGDDRVQKARFIGEILGQLSLALSGIDAAVNDNNIYETAIHWALPRVKEAADLPETLCKKLSEAFRELYPHLPKQIIHRDPNPGNIVAGEETWGFLDFELSERNVRIYDPCYAATAILSESFDRRDEARLSSWIDIYRNIMYGYDSVAKLRTEEWAALPYVILCNQLICCAWFSEQQRFQQLFRTNIEMTTWICANFDRLAIPG